MVNKLRETTEERIGSDDRLINFLAKMIQSEYDRVKGQPNPQELAAMIVDHLNGLDPRRRIRNILILQANGKPICWICNRRIFLDEERQYQENKRKIHLRAIFSIDHVLRLADGGKTVLDNCKPAHNFCNANRHAQRNGNRTKSKMTELFKYLDQRTQDENDMGTSLSGKALD